MKFTATFAFWLAAAITTVTTNALVTPQQASIAKAKSSYAHGNNHRNHGPLSTTEAGAVDLNDVPRGGASNVGGGTATIPNEVFNLVKSIVGAGGFSLPAGKPTTIHKPKSSQRLL